jgi:hypothetical protein
MMYITPFLYPSMLYAIPTSLYTVSANRLSWPRLGCAEKDALMYRLQHIYTLLHPPHPSNPFTHVTLSDTGEGVVEGTWGTNSGDGGPRSQVPRRIQ